MRAENFVNGSTEESPGLWRSEPRPQHQDELRRDEKGCPEEHFSALKYLLVSKKPDALGLMDG